MNDIIQIIPVAVAAFIATHLDNFALLVTFLVRYRHRTPTVAAAYFTSIALLCWVSYGIGSAASIVPVEFIGWLGIVPIALGIAGVVGLIRQSRLDGATRENLLGGKTAFLATLVSQLGNGADTIVTLGALFADSNPASDTLIVLTLAAMALIFFASGHYAIRHPSLATWIEEHAHKITPFILIIVGVYIVAATATDVLLN